MSVAKTTVDKLLKGYDIRLRPDFGGTCHDYICLWVEGLNNSGFGHDDIYESSLSRELPKSWPVAKKKKKWGWALKWLLPCHYYASIHIIEDGCSSRSRAYMETSRQTLCLLKSGRLNALIFNTFLNALLIRDVLWPLRCTLRHTFGPLTFTGNYAFAHYNNVCFYDSLKYTTRRTTRSCLLRRVIVLLKLFN